MNNPEYIEVNNKKYKINTDFRIAIRCNEIAEDESISNIERIMAIIYLLFGEEALEDYDNYEEIMDMAYKYLSCNDDSSNNNTSNERDMDYIQDYAYIKASFMSDYGIDITNKQIHWWDFYAYLSGLTETCVLNRVRNIRTYDLSEIDDYKTKEKMRKQKENLKLKDKNVHITTEQQKSVDKFYELTGIKRKE